MSVEKRSSKCAAFFAEREMLRAVRGGTKAMRAAGVKYLPKELGESDPGYKNRLSRSVFSNFTERAVKNLSSKPFTKAVSITSQRQQDVADSYVKSVDTRGTSLTALSARVFEDALWQGTSFIAVDAPAGGGRPYAYMLSGDNILGYRVDEDDQLTEIRIAEKTVVPDGDFDEKEVGQVRVFKRKGDVVTWDLWQEINGNYIQTESEMPFALSEIPVAPVHAGLIDGSGCIFAPSPMQDLAYLNVLHYQKSSDIDNILHIAQIPVLFGSGIADDSKITIGAEYAIKGDTGSDLKWVEISGGSISAGRQSIQDLEAQMSAYGSEMLQNTGATETATGRALRAGENNNQIAQAASGLESALEKAMGWIGKFLMISEPDFVADVHKDYGISASSEELTALTQARTLGDLSREDFLQEYKRRGILRSSFSAEDNADRLSTEMY